ncbi:MAG: FG-GAP-like repeat-containing protein, partial [Prevotellaceae bacterium]|nr:FG-GAP-like repeat-containing protein [Prevotellaceae bacterium]
MSTVFADAQQNLKAVDDYATTGPLQTVRVNVLANDTLTCSHYTLTIISNLNTATQGTATRINGSFIEFTPALPCRNTNVEIVYGITCNGVQVTAKLIVHVAEYNRAVNIVDENLECYEIMPDNINFGVHRKFPTYSNATSYTPPDGWIDGYTSPLIGDLTGDGKPEIVIAGNSSSVRQGNTFAVHSINIYNGQTGSLMHKYDIRTGSGLGWSAFTIGGEFHRAPSIFALADLDNDGLGEIVICNAVTGRVAALKPVVSNFQITDLTVMWQGTDHNGSVMSYKAPITSNLPGVYGYPNPYVADIDADGTPEVIVYNKIFDGKSGHLLMSWRGSASTPQASSYGNSVTADDTDLEDVNYSDPVSSGNASNIKRAAMTGRRPSSNDIYTDRYLAVPAIVDIDGDGKQEIITGNRIHKFNIIDKNDHRNNTYTTIEGPLSVTVPESGGNATYYLNDGYTRVADIDNDGKLDIIVACSGSYAHDDDKIIVYVWNINNTASVKACVSFGADTRHGCFSIPFIGDINGKLDGWDGSGWNKKLPEICILSGGVYINRYNNMGNRTGVKFHPKSDDNLRKGAGNDKWDNNDRTNTDRRFNRDIGGASGFEGHIIGLTWDDSATAVEEKLKISWGMEHSDESDETGLTLFDFDNNNTADLCYRDENTLRVISPGKSQRDYVELSENENSPNTSVMFSTTVYSGTAFEYPAIADVNMDGSADIVVTNTGITSNQFSGGWIEVYEYSGDYKWASCPPVWNQGMYDPTQVREDLKINARPISVITPYTKNGETIYPYNGSWMQVPIVRESQDFVPVVREPDAVLQDVRVNVVDAAKANVTVVIFNNGTATLAANTPISFYNGGISGSAIESSDFIKTETLDVDIFPNEKKTLQYEISGAYNKCLIWVRVMADNTEFPAAGFDDCNLANNSFAGIDCPYLNYSIQASSTVICGMTGAVMLKAIPDETPHDTPVYQWYKDEVIIQGATSQIYFATDTGVYKCYVIENICREYSSSVTITHEDSQNLAIPNLATAPANGKLCINGNVMLEVENFADYSSGSYIWIKDGIPFDTTTIHYVNIPHSGIASGHENGGYQVFVTVSGCSVLSAKDSIKTNTGEAIIPLISKIPDNSVICGDSGSVLLQITNMSAMTGSTFQWYKDGRLISGAADFHYVATEAGSYSVNASLANGCSALSSDIEVAKIHEESPDIVVPAKLYVGKTANLSLSLSGTWTSSDTAIATVDNNGIITGLAEGKVQFMFTSAAGCSVMSDTVIIVNEQVETMNAYDDMVAAIYNQPIDIDVLANDSVSCLPDLTQLKIDTVAGSGLHKGSIVINSDKTLTYTPNHNVFGIDSVDYTIEYLSVVKRARIYIIVSKPISLHNVACPDVQLEIGMHPIPGVAYIWYDDPTGIIPILPITQETIVVTKDDSPEQPWYAAPVLISKMTIFPVRYPVTIFMADNCGSENPVGCAVDGQLLFREDFGGNAYSSPRISTTGLPAGTTAYNFVKTDKLTANQYALVKYIVADNDYAWQKNFSDHTNSADKDSGYMFLVDASTNSGKFYETQITGLCDNINKLYFSVWITNVIPTNNTTANDNPILRFELSDMNDNIIGTYVTSSVPKDPINSVKWRNYGFTFNPQGYNSLKLKIYNNRTGSNGNDFAMDDIEIRLCIPPVTVTNPLTDTVCSGSSSYTFSASYTDDGTFTGAGNKLVYRWQYSADNDSQSVWTTVKEGTGNSSTLNTTFTINNVTDANQGYYRLLIANSSTIDYVNCRNMSKPVYLHVLGKLAKPAISSLYGNYNLCGNINTLTLKVTNPGNGILYQWYKDDTILTSETELSLTVNAPGLYKVQATDSITGCSVYTDTTVTQDLNINFPNPVISSVSGGTAICGTEGSVRLTLSNRSAYSADAVYQWYKNGQIITNATSANYNAITFGEYYIVVKDKTCLAVSATITITDANSGTNITKPDLKSNGDTSVLCSGTGSLLLYVSNTNSFSSAATYVWY